MRVVTLNNKATICIALKRVDEALGLLQQAREIAAKYSFEDTGLYFWTPISLIAW